MANNRLFSPSSSPRLNSFTQFAAASPCRGSSTSCSQLGSAGDTFSYSRFPGDTGDNNHQKADGVGYFIGGVVSLSVIRKRGTGLAIIASFGVLIIYLMTILLPGVLLIGILNIVLDLLGIAIRIFVAVTRLR